MNSNQKKEIIIYSILVFIGLITVGIIIYHDHEMLKEEQPPVSETEETSAAEENDANVNVPTEENSTLTDDEIISKPTENEPANNNSSNNSTTTNNNNNSSNNTKPSEEVKPNNSNPTETPTSTNNNNNNENNLSSKDQKVIEEVENLEHNVDTLLTNSKDDKTFKGVFISLVDFLFYDGKIKGITFAELTDQGKQKVLSIVARIDAKIEAKFPGYKEKISSKTSAAFNKISELIKKGAANINDFTKEKLGETDYQALIDEKDELVLYTKNAFSLVKNFSTNLWNKTTTKLKEWYEKYRESN